MEAGLTKRVSLADRLGPAIEDYAGSMRLPKYNKKIGELLSEVRAVEAKADILDGNFTFFCTNEKCPFSSQDIIEAKSHDDARHDSDLEGEADAAISIVLTGIRV